MEPFYPIRYPFKKRFKTRLKNYLTIHPTPACDFNKNHQPLSKLYYSKKHRILRDFYAQRAAEKSDMQQAKPSTDNTDVFNHVSNLSTLNSKISNIIFFNYNNFLEQYHEKSKDQQKIQTKKYQHLPIQVLPVAKSYVRSLVQYSKAHSPVKSFTDFLVEEQMLVKVVIDGEIFELYLTKDGNNNFFWVRKEKPDSVQINPKTFK